MKVAVFSTKSYDRKFLESANKEAKHEISFFEVPLNERTVVLSEGFGAICVFVNDRVNAEVVEKLHEYGVRLIALRAAGFNNVDLEAVQRYDMHVARVPAYSPYAVAEHTVGLILALNRKLHRAYNRVREANFELAGLLGFDLNGRTAGVVGTGKIGTVVAKILDGFGCTLLGYDPYPNEECIRLGVEYVALEELFARSDIITLHSPLTPETYHIVDEKALRVMKKGVMLINTSRGALIDTQAVVGALKSRKLGYLGLDVYEEESNLFFKDLSGRVLEDDVFARLLTFPNVLITGHQAFFTEEALCNIAETTIGNLSAFAKEGRALHEVTLEAVT